MTDSQRGGRFGGGRRPGGNVGRGRSGGNSGYGGQSRGSRRDDQQRDRGPLRGRGSGRPPRFSRQPRFEPRDVDQQAPSMPATPPGQTARQVALAALLAAAYSNDYVNEHLDAEIARGGLSPVERPLATELTFGVVRRKNTLDALLRVAVTRPRANVEPALWMLLRLGTYQLALCDGIADYAAISETVELGRWLGRDDWTGFANGCLRSVARLLTEEFTESPSPVALPLTAGRYRKLAQPIFAFLGSKTQDRDESRPPDEPNRSAGPLDRNALSYLSKAFSLPPWLLEKWSARFDFDELCRLGFWFNTPSSLCLRVNRLRTDRETLLAKFGSASISARPGDLPCSIWLECSARVDQLPGFAEGEFVVQDESAQQAAELLAPQPGEMVLDLCAAPGTKTTHLAELMRNEGRIVATDSSEARLALVPRNAERLGLSIIETAVVSLDDSNLPAGPFDAILIDAPCSNTGVLGKRPDARWRLQPEDLEELSRIQLRLLLAAADRLKPGGRIVYSTCSIEPEENAAVVEAVCHFRPKLKVIEQRELRPGQTADGGFQCLLKAE